MASVDVREHQSLTRWWFVAIMTAVLGVLLMPSSLAVASHGGTVVCDPSTGHCYEYVAGPLNWYDAKASAEAMVHDGVTGHLATITSAAETNFIVANLPDAVFHIPPFVGGAYIGAFQPGGSPEPDGGWQWVTGETWDYTNWAGGEPNNAGDENVAHFWQGAGAWNDANGDLLKGYLVEYDAPHGIREIEIALDVKPGSCPNPLNTKDKGVLPAAILGTADFDVGDVDASTVKLEGVSPLRSNLEDVATPYTGGLSDPPDRDDCTTARADGFMDLPLKFDAKAVITAIGPVSDGQVVVLTLTGNLRDGTPIVGQDVVWIRKK